MYQISKNEYDVVFKKKDGVHGLDRKDVLEMLDLIGSEEFYPNEISSLDIESSCMGFITQDAANRIGYSYEDPYSDFSIFVQALIEDLPSKQPISGTENIYDFHGTKVWFC